ncbi:unnamed protein product [Linum trigynum]|uniref:Uncharacterized protein n=1 Tax=Linum trigynum TaxID=586398 RepID=A0AAV2CW61_9ROSI
MGFEPGKMMFIDVISTFASLAKSTRQGKFDVYMRWGLSEEEVSAAFQKRPFFLNPSEEQITGVMDLFVNKLRWDASLVAMNPVIVSLSLKKRLLPRAAVLEFLTSKGLVKKDYRAPYFFIMTDQLFFSTHVHPYDEALEIHKLYVSKLSPS